MRSRPFVPYQTPTTTTGSAREVSPWPFGTMALGPAALGVGLALRTRGSEGWSVGALFVAIAIAIAFLGGMQRRRARQLVGTDHGEVRVFRGASSGRVVEASAIQVRAHHLGVTIVYGMLGVGLANSSFKVMAAGPSLPTAASIGQVSERLTGGGAGVFLGLLFAVAVWRRAVCTRIIVPQERRSLWVRDDDLPRLGIQEPST